MIVSSWPCQAAVTWSGTPRERMCVTLVCVTLVCRVPCGVQRQRPNVGLGAQLRPHVGPPFRPERLPVLVDGDETVPHLDEPVGGPLTVP